MFRERKNTVILGLPRSKNFLLQDGSEEVLRLDSTAGSSSWINVFLTTRACQISPLKKCFWLHKRVGFLVYDNFYSDDNWKERLLLILVVKHRIDFSQGQITVYDNSPLDGAITVVAKSMKIIKKTDYKQLWSKRTDLTRLYWHSWFCEIQTPNVLKWGASSLLAWGGKTKTNYSRLADEGVLEMASDSTVVSGPSGNIYGVTGVQRTCNLQITCSFYFMDETFFL